MDQLCRNFLSRHDEFRENDPLIRMETHHVFLESEVSKLTEALKTADNREVVMPEVLQRICSTFSLVSREIIACDEEIPELVFKLDLATTCTRCMRNACAGNIINGSHFTSNGHLFEDMRRLIDRCIQFEQREKCPFSEHVVVLLKCSLQLLGNVATLCVENGNLIWDHVFELFLGLWLINDTDIKSYTSMLLYNCILADTKLHVSQLVTSHRGQQIVSSLLIYLATQDQEWGLFIIQQTLHHPSLMSNFYEKSPSQERNLLVDITLFCIEEMEKSDSSAEATKTNIVKTDVSEENVKFICCEFKTNAFKILDFNQGCTFNHEDCILVGKLLEILSVSSAQLEKFIFLASDMDLLECVLNMLHSFQQLASSNKLSDLSEVACQNPTYGLRTNIIRLLANLVYENQKMQDQVRQLGGIPIILDNTKIDIYNPYITQWSVFAIRNLMNGNQANQAILYGMKLDGLSHDVEELRALGVEAELHGEKIVIRNICNVD